MSLRLLVVSTILVVALPLAFSALARAAENPVVIVETTLGNFSIELYPERAPKSVENFLQYVDDGYFTDTIFHRVIPGFMVQGGGMTADMQRKPTRGPIENEARNGLKNARGTVAMARTGEINSATSQFFVNVKDNAFLDHKGPGRDFGYAVFGKVVEGMDVVDKIEAVKTTTRGPYENVPLEPVVIKAVRRKTS
jgi:peptidyl-prolyl cis-trans isomerase A (cyclophilin A)